MNLRKIFSKPKTQSYSVLSEDDINDIKDLFQEYSDKWSRKLVIEWNYDVVWCGTTQSPVTRILRLSIHGIVSGDGINQYKDIVKDLVKYCARLEKFGFKSNRGVKDLISLTAAHVYVNIYKPNSIQENNVFEPLNNPDLEDLEDYLQEIFDTYAIHKRPENESDAEDLHASGGSYYWLSQPKYDYITIEKLGYKKGRVIDAIMKAKSNIEKRLKREIVIENSPMKTDWLGIGIKKFHWDDAKKRQQQNEGYGYKHDPIIEDLEDYLQEVFDKFGIKKSTEAESPLYPNYFIRKYERASISITECGEDLLNSIHRELARIKPLLEKRLNKKISISKVYSSSPDCLTIRVIPEKLKRDDKGRFILPKNINEATKFPRWVSPKEKLYFTISEIEANDTKKRYNAIELTDEEIRFLKAKLYLPKEAKMNKFRSGPLHSRFGIEILNSQGKWVFKINKLQDEWFICYYNMGIIENSGGNNIEVFKCDQMDGLLQCLKYFINKRHVSFDYVPPRNSWSDSKKKNTWAYTPWYMK